MHSFPKGISIMWYANSFVQDSAASHRPFPTMKTITLQFYIPCILLIYFIFHKVFGNTYGIVANVLNCDIEVSEFELQLRYYIHFRTNSLEKATNSLIPPRWTLNSTYTLFLQGWLWHYVTHEGWYAIKQSNPPKSAALTATVHISMMANRRL